jgi:hypothetical protein
LKRKPSFRASTQDDMAYLFAAYKKGGDFDLPDGLTPAEFDDYFLRRFEGFDGYTTLVAPVNGKQQPVGVVAIVGAGGDKMEPHVIWFPWALPRNRLEASAQFLNEMRKSYNVLIFTRLDVAKLYDRLCDYGILRRVGTPERWYSDGAPAAMYQTKELI